MLSCYENSIYIAAIIKKVEAGIEAIEKHFPKIVFLDINLVDEAGNTLLERIRNWDFEVITLSENQFYTMKTHKYSSAGYLLKQITIDKLKEIIRNFQ